MAHDLNNEAIEMLEQLVDKFTLSKVLETLGGICLDKADHIICNWQDKQTASHWTAAGSDLQDLARNKNYL